MRNFIEVSDGFVGFGATREEAIEDCYIAKCIASLSNDTEEKFTKRREELHPWLPMSNLLHISGVGCLMYKDYRIIETKSGRSVSLLRKDGSIFYYMSQLFQDSLSFTDIAVVLRPEIEQFFKNISEEFASIKEYPQIQLLNNDNGFKPIVIYNTSDGIIIGNAGSQIGIKFVGDSHYYVTDVDSNFVTMDMLSYVGLKLGVIFTEEGAFRVGRIY